MLFRSRGVSPRETIGRGFIVLVCTVSLGAFLAGCPPHGPVPVVPPDASDAAPTPKPVGCVTACDHAQSVCPGSGGPCLSSCNRIAPNSPAFPGCVLAASGCLALDACDSLNAPSAAPKPRGK